MVLFIIMSEFSRSSEIEPEAEVIARGLGGWLKKEVGSSAVGRNQYLDDFEEFRSSLSLLYNNHNNSNAEKNRSHYNRLAQWTDGLTRYYEGFDSEQRDYALARQIFCAQMYLSGLFRAQCLMQASDQEDYYHRRLDGSFIGIDLEDTISARLDQSPAITPRLDEIAERTLMLNDKQQTYVEQLHLTGRDDAGRQTSPTVNTVLALQKEWVDLVVDYAVFAANERGGKLSAVPFLEPKSISDDPQVYYPFAGAA